MLVDGAVAFPAMLRGIAEAKKSIWLESYIFESDRTGGEFVHALVKQARRGVEVRVIVDAFGGLELSHSDREALAEAGVQLRFFGPFRSLDLSRWLKRDHRKLLLIDGRRAFVGGINISDDYAARNTGGKGWHDIHVCITGPVCYSLASVFARTWRVVGGPPLAMPEPPTEENSGDWAMALCSNHRGVRTRIRSHWGHALHRAQREVLLASAYFVPDHRTIWAMEGAAKRGVYVGLLVPGEGDMWSVQAAGEHSYERLLAAGVHVFTWRGSHMHAKAAVVDEHWCHVGSYNLDYVSLLQNLELVVELVGSESPPALARLLRSNMQASPEVTLEAWRARPWSDKAVSRFAYQFRRWL